MKKKNYKVQQFSLPAFAWLDYGEFDNEGKNLLYGRSIIYHVRSASVIEIIEKGTVNLNPGVKTYEFSYNGAAGEEKYLAVLHYCVTTDDDETITEILKMASEWFNRSNAYEDSRQDFINN